MRKTWRQKILLVLLGLGLPLVSSLAKAAVYDRNGNKLPDAKRNSIDVNWELLYAEEGKKYNGVGIIGYASDGFCTGFFLNTGGADSSPAYAITNGHCYDGSTMLDAKEILLNKTSTLVFKLNYFVNNKNLVRPVRVRQVVYATMKGTDIAILELDTTFKQLVKEGFTPLTIEDVPPSTGEPIEIIGIPMTQILPARRFLHRSVCQVGESVNLREDIYIWEKAIRHRCSALGGMSGSPVISLKTNRVVGIHNTSVTDRALTRTECAEDRPCEVRSDGKLATFPHENYAQMVSNVPSCFDRKGIFNLNLPLCKLEKPN
jgi:hypothetical protein